MAKPELYASTKKIGLIGERLQDKPVILRDLFAKWGLIVLSAENVANEHGGWDFLVTVSTPTNRQRTLRVEVKTDQRGAKTKRYAIEFYQDIFKPTLGWYAYSKADIFVFVWTKDMCPKKVTAVWADSLDHCVRRYMNTDDPLFYASEDRDRKRFGEILCLPQTYVEQLPQSECSILTLDLKKGEFV